MYLTLLLFACIICKKPAHLRFVFIDAIDEIDAQIAINTNKVMLALYVIC